MEEETTKINPISVMTCDHCKKGLIITGLEKELGRFKFCDRKECGEDQKKRTLHNFRKWDPMRRKGLPSVTIHRQWRGESREIYYSLYDLYCFLP